MYAILCMCVGMYVCMYVCMYIGVGAGPGFGRTTFIQGKNETSFLQKQAMNRSASMIFRLVRLIILLYNR